MVAATPSTAPAVRSRTAVAAGAPRTRAVNRAVRNRAAVMWGPSVASSATAAAMLWTAECARTTGSAAEAVRISAAAPVQPKPVVTWEPSAISSAMVAAMRSSAGTARRQRLAAAPEFRTNAAMATPDARPRAARTSARTAGLPRTVTVACLTAEAAKPATPAAAVRRTSAPAAPINAGATSHRVLYGSGFSGRPQRDFLTNDPRLCPG